MPSHIQFRTLKGVLIIKDTQGLGFMQIRAVNVTKIRKSRI